MNPLLDDAQALIGELFDGYPPLRLRALAWTADQLLQGEIPSTYEIAIAATTLVPSISDEVTRLERVLINERLGAAA